MAREPRTERHAHAQLLDSTNPTSRTSGPWHDDFMHHSWLDAAPARRRPRIPAGCTAQGRQPQAAEGGHYLQADDDAGPFTWADCWRGFSPAARAVLITAAVLLAGGITYAALLP